MTISTITPHIYLTSNIAVRFIFHAITKGERIITVCTIESTQGWQLTGASIKHPDDVENVRLGEKLAVTDAIKYQSRPFRSLIWDAYWKICNPPPATNVK